MPGFFVTSRNLTIYVMRKKIFTTLLFSFSIITLISGQDKLKPDSGLVNGLKFRSIGPAMASGRIADFAVNPNNPFEYYVAVASGNIWKTINNGTTFQPVFDNYNAYAIGCLAIDPNNSNIVWAGTGENNSQRALGYGNGIYKSLDGGSTWTNMGLKTSRQIGKILIDPRDSEVIYVAVEGSVWGSGGERGVYMTINGGKDWIKILEISENTGAYDLEFHPTNPNTIYATVHQRRRRAYTKINGGPESAIYKTTNGGKDWKKITKGLPDVHLGRIGLAITPAEPDWVYAIVEAADNKGGFYRSTNRGETWERMSDYTSSGQYYTTLYADPQTPLRVYSMDTFSKMSEDGGKTWKDLSTKSRHVDDHAFWIDPNATDHIRIGGDGGVYESFDRGENWEFKGNLPITQFYRVNVDNSEPFYNVYGGSQDNNSLGGPSQNLFDKGVSNDEWFVTIGGDGFWIAIDPNNPNIIYSEYQYGNAYRYNHVNGELVYIRPQEPKGSLTYKWNWDAPLILSTHNSNKIYMAANKVFMSENRGDSWTEISDDLTAQKDRNDFKVMGKYWSGDAVAKDVSTSQFGTIISLAESQIKDGLIYSGSDDGIIQITENMGQLWKKADSRPGVPAYTPVSDICPSLFDENVVFASFNNNKSNDFNPYIYMSVDKGKSWKPIMSNLPEGAVYTILQDFKNPEMLFCGTEFGLYVSFNTGKEWIRIKNGLPDIAVRDIVIQERENDLVIATFGRGFYILHNYTTLREISSISTDETAHLFSIKTSKSYIPRYDRRNYNGDNFYITKNPPFGAEFTYYLKESIITEKAQRQKKDSELFKKDEKIKVNTWEEDRIENLEETPYLLFVIKNNDGEIVRKLTAEANEGINRIYWDLKYAFPTPIPSTIKEFDPFKEVKGGLFVPAGEYNVCMYSSKNSELEKLTDQVNFSVKGLEINKFDGLDRFEADIFYNNLNKLNIRFERLKQELSDALNTIKRLKTANLNSTSFDPDLNKKLIDLEKEIANYFIYLNGYVAKASYEEVPPAAVPIAHRIDYLFEATMASSEGIIEGQRETYAIVLEELNDLEPKIKAHIESIKSISEDRMSE